MDTEEPKREVCERMKLSDSAIPLNLINGETRIIKIIEAKGLKQMIDKNTGSEYNRIYLRHKDKESGHVYLDVASPCFQDLLDLLSPSLQSVKLRNIK